MSGPAWFPARRDVVMVHGPDAGDYLHSQLSQEVRDLGVGQARWTFLLEPGGKVEVLARVLRSGDAAFVLDVDAGWGDALIARLQRFRIRVAADLTPIPWRCLAVRGAAVAAPPGAVAVPGWWGDDTDLLGPDPSPPEHLTGGTAADLEAARVAAGWPAMGCEIVAGTLPAETGVVPVAVSFTKGCYPGQELVERMESRGATAPRLLRRVALPGPVEGLVGAAVLVGSDEVGRVTSAAGRWALALVHRRVEVPAAATLATPGGHLDVRLEPQRP